MIRRLAILELAFAAIALPIDASHEGGGMQLKTCVQRAGVHDVYWAHLTAFQDGKRFCYAVPKAGNAVLVIDVKRRLQEIPIAVRVFHSETGERLVDQLPARYPSGVLEIEAPFAVPGAYEVSLESDEARLVFPLAVGVSAGIGTTVTYLGIELMKKPNLLILGFLFAFSLIAAWRFLVASGGDSSRKEPS